MNYSQKIILILISFMFLQLLNAQNLQKVDSLEMLIEKESGIEKANLLKQIGDNYIQTEYYKKALINYQKALEIYNECNDTLLLASIIKKIGNIYYELFNFDKALKHYIKALKLYEKLNDLNGVSEALNCVGNTYVRIFNDDKALEYYLKSYKISEQIGNKKGLYNVLNNIGIIYMLNIKDYDKALEYFHKSLLLIEESNDSAKMATPIQNIAIVYNKMQKYDTALYYYFKALKLNEELQQNLKVALVASNIAILYIEINDLKSAKKYLDRSLKILTEIEAKGITANNYYHYTLLYALKGDLNNMQKYSDLYIAIKDSIIYEQSIHQIAEMRTKYETVKKEQNIKMLNIENKLKETQLQTRTYWLVIFIIGFALIFIYIILKRNLLFVNKNLVEKNLEIVVSEKKLTDANVLINKIVNNDKENPMESKQILDIKYAGSPLSIEQKQDIKKIIINYMNNSKNFLNVDYSINTLSKEINISRTYTSQVINEMFGQSFSAFLNEYRIKEARKIMSSSNNFKYTIEYFAKSVGYKSTTTYTEAFKKHVGVTPSFYLNYLKNNLHQVSSMNN